MLISQLVNAAKLFLKIGLMFYIIICLLYYPFINLTVISKKYAGVSIVNVKHYEQVKGVVIGYSGRYNATINTCSTHVLSGLCYVKVLSKIKKWLSQKGEVK